MAGRKLKHNKNLPQGRFLYFCFSPSSSASAGYPYNENRCGTRFYFFRRGVFERSACGCVCYKGYERRCGTTLQISRKYILLSEKPAAGQVFLFTDNITSADRGCSLRYDTRRHPAKAYEAGGTIKTRTTPMQKPRATFYVFSFGKRRFPVTRSHTTLYTSTAGRAAHASAL